MTLDTGPRIINVSRQNIFVTFKSHCLAEKLPISPAKRRGTHFFHETSCLVTQVIQQILVVRSPGAVTQLALGRFLQNRNHEVIKTRELPNDAKMSVDGPRCSRTGKMAHNRSEQASEPHNVGFKGGKERSDGIEVKLAIT